ncbi:MAG: succinate dehydrogenase assembly factor 2 [Thiohalocapsa sp.]
MSSVPPINDGSAGGSAQQRTEQEIARLRWQCRRGMLELDLLLNRFLESAYADLTDQQRIDFVRLLGYQDQIIYDWLMGQAVPAEPALRDLVARIRAAMRP